MSLPGTLTVYQFSDSVVEFRVRANVSRILAAKLHASQVWVCTLVHIPQSERTSRPTPLKLDPAAACATAFPPTTLPVKLTKSTLGCATAMAVSSGERCTTCSRSVGSPARVHARAKRSAASGVCGEGFSMTELPAIRAGRTELIEVR